jgi:2-hydroxy-3-oxopropionate reductase
VTAAVGPGLPEGPIGLVGVGLMGKPMAQRLLGAGFEVVVFHRRPEQLERLTSAGAVAAPDIASLAAAAGLVMCMLPAAEHVREVLAGEGGVLSAAREGVLVVDSSTTGPAPARQMAQMCAARGVRFIDAPVSGGVVGAERGELSIMVGGDGADLAAAWPVLSALGALVVHCGPVGAGQVAKAANQLVVAVTIEAVAEALVLARAAGADPGKVRQALLGGFAASRVLELHGQRMLEGDIVPGGLARLQLKDLQIVSSLADAAGLELPELSVALERFSRLVEREGMGDSDHSAVALLFQRDYGLEIGPPARLMGTGDG